MKTRFYLILCCYTIFMSSWAVVYAQLPYNNTAISGDEFSSFIGSGKVEFKDHGMELTTKANETNGVFLNEVLLASERGFILGFDYLMTGRGGDASGQGAHGLALVLFDGSLNNPTIGSKTSGLGYSYSKATDATKAIQGVSKGFLSIGLDLYGDFKERTALDTEFRNGIKMTRKQSNHITVRGQGNQLEGYPVLLSQSVTAIGDRYKLDLDTGVYRSVFDAPDSKGFSFKLRENKVNNESDINASFGHASYRRVIVNFLPGKKSGDSGFYLNVDIIHGSETSRVINALFIPINSNFKYQEATSITANTLKVKQIIAPTFLKIGFTATTGTVFQKNIIRNISMSLPFSPVVQDVQVSNACKDHTTTLDILANSVGFDTDKYVEGQNIAAVGSKEHLDPYSFNFLTLVDNERENTLEPYVAVTAAGRYEYNPQTMEVVFIPKKGLTAGQDVVYFSIKNKRKVVGDIDLGGEQYRSESAKIELNFTHNCNDIIMVNGSAL
ncbi:Uncharacterised protein [Myroides odoratus]|uniref:Uncharacterized protein n=2 Tax=Myroides odoratus TaxID=256 RepID=A0A378RLJ6_MYROD|nr:Uncharacterised protein [Myroides odoratus]